MCIRDSPDSDRITDEFDLFWNKKQREAFERLCMEENIKADNLTTIISEYLWTERKPLPDTIVSLLDTKPKLLERKPVVERITEKILNFVDVFINGMS